MSIRNTLETLRDGIADNTSLKAYCQNNYGKDQTVYLGLDKKNPPNEDETPVIIIAYVERTEKRGTRTSYKVIIGYSVTKSTITTVDNKKTYEGFILSEELKEKTESVILGLQYDLGKIVLESDYVDNTIFPQFTASSSIIIENINTSRS